MSVLYFPQLASGALAQYPITRRWSKAATVNVLPDGSTVVMASVTPPRVLWDLRYSGLSTLDWGAIQSLFAAVQGQYKTFVFLDPTDNLLTWTEDLSSTAWTKDPLLQLATGIGDPLGGSAASQLTNNSQAPQQLFQSVAGPSWYQYCFSLYLKADAPCVVNLIRGSTGGSVSEAVAADGSWSRVVASGSLGGATDGVRFGVELAPGTSVFVFGPQVEAQPGAGPYKSKTAGPGVYTKSRFDQDTLVQTSESVEQHSTIIQVTATY